jgi:Zn-dependent protease with chaperone function
VTVDIYLPLLLPLLVALAARWTAEHARPAVAVRGLVTAAVVAAIASVWSLVMLAMTGFDDVPPLAGRDRPEPVPDAIAVLAIGALVWGAVRLVRDLHRRHDTARRLRAAGSPADGLVVADWTAPLAVAVPGRPGHLLVTTGMLRGLDAHERRAVLAHERAHLHHRHHLPVAWVAAAAAVNPLLRPVRETVTYLVERWADEEAAAAVDDRRLVARAVARAALATVGPEPAGALGVHGGVIVRRVRALDRPPARADGRVVAAATMAVLACLVAGAAATEDFVELARAWIG